MRLHRIPVSAFVLCMAGLAASQTVERLWANRKAPWPIPVPAGLDTTRAMTDTSKNPYLTVYQPSSNANGAAVVIMPGGGYEHLSPIREGRNVAIKFNGYGVTGFVLRYRYGVVAGNAPFQHPIEMWDAQRSVRWVRANAARFGIDPRRVGVIGFSAGGHLASTVATHFDTGNPDSTSINYYPGVKDSVDAVSCRPDFQILGYPVINMDSSIAHAGSRTALLGTNPSQALLRLLSNERQVTANTPPGFVFAARNDATVPPQNSRAYADSLRKKVGIGDTLFVATGGHGFGLADGQDGAVNDASAKVWPDTARAWLQKRGFLTTTVIFPGQAGKVSSKSYLKGSQKNLLDALGRNSKQPHGIRVKTLPSVK
ncbi:MAG TPA: alpha/beta hydrolase [Fibrobacteres bacterium]|jgi:acetyl esterase/lipase|nr:alpha/beta hydrolase [Fibrobacterota bacterium]